MPKCLVPKCPEIVSWYTHYTNATHPSYFRSGIHTQLYLVQKRRQQFLLLSMTCDEKFLWINFFHHYYYYQSINVNNLTQTFIIKPRQLPIHHRSVSCADCVGLCQLISFSSSNIWRENKKLWSSHLKCCCCCISSTTSSRRVPAPVNSTIL